jgi:hypothetical protein
LGQKQYPSTLVRYLASARAEVFQCSFLFRAEDFQIPQHRKALSLVATEKRHAKIQTKLTNLIMILKISTFATVFVLLFCGQTIRAQITLHTEDLPRFYQAFDSVVTTIDSTRQVGFLNTLYVDKASKGLNEFIQLRNIRKKKPH